MDLQLAISTNYGYMSVPLATTTGVPLDLSDKSVAAVPCVLRRASGSGDIDYGDAVTLWLGTHWAYVDRLAAKPYRVRLGPVPARRVWDRIPLPGFLRPKIVIQQADTFTIEHLPSQTGHFQAGCQFALVAADGCVRARDGYVEVGGGVDADAPARLTAKY